MIKPVNFWLELGSFEALRVSRVSGLRTRGKVYGNERAVVKAKSTVKRPLPLASSEAVNHTTTSLLLLLLLYSASTVGCDRLLPPAVYASSLRSRWYICLD